MKRKMEGQAAALYILLFLMPFCMGGYLVWCSALAACFLSAVLYCSVKDGIGEDCWGSPGGIDYAMVSLICLPASLLAASLWGVDQGQAWFGFVKFVPMPLFLAAVRRIPEKRRDKLWDVVPLGGIAMTVVSAAMWCIPVTRDWVQVNGRLAGFFQYPNTYAVYLLCGILVKIERPSSRLRRDAIGCLVLAAGLLLSGSRTTLALAVASVAALLWHRRGNVNVRAVFFVLTGGSVLLTFFLTVTGNLAVLKRYLILPTRSSTFLGRLLYAADALPVIARHPLGLGYMGYYFLQGSFQTGVYATRHIHNELLQLLLDAGWMPAVVILYTIWKTFRRLGYYKRLLLIVLLAHSLFDFDFQFISTGCILVLLMAEEGGEQKRVFCQEVAQRRKAKKYDGRRAGRKQSGISLLKRLSAVVLAAFCLWVGAADFLAYFKQPETVVSIYPAHTESWMVLLTRTETPEEMNRIANQILRYNQSVSLAYDAKAAAAYADGDAQKMIAYKLQAIALARYEMSKYEDYSARLFTFFQMYLNAGMTSSADYCRERLLEIPAMLEQMKENSSLLAWRIYEKPQLELTEEMQRRLAVLQDIP